MSGIQLPRNAQSDCFTVMARSTVNMMCLCDASASSKLGERPVRLKSRSLTMSASTAQLSVSGNETSPRHNQLSVPGLLVHSVCPCVSWIRLRTCFPNSSFAQ